MSQVHLYTNTTEDLPCTNCGSPGNVVREANVPEDKKLKCHACGFMYSAADSIAAKEAGAIPDEPPEINHAQGAEIQPEVDSRDSGPTETGWAPAGGPSRSSIAIPKRPTFVLVSKDRTQSEFAGAKTVKSIILRWEYEGRKFDLFELTPKKASTRVDLE